MTLRPLRTGRFPANEPAAVLDYEIAQEQAAALGRMGRALERALAALSAFESTSPSGKAARSALVQAASDALWHFIVQREASGLRDARQVMRDYHVPAEVQARMGASVGKPRSQA
jgi:hypothetical protein